MSTKLFGRSYQSTGSSDSDFLIKTKGKIKIQYGSKFIDLIKDGKLNIDSGSQFIHKSNEVGTQDGIYVSDKNEVTLQSGGVQIPLSSSGNTYISYLEKQDTTSDNKYTALSNIGFLCKDKQSVSTNGLKNGIIYIESEQKLYIVSDGNLSEYVVSTSIPGNQQFIIQKNDSKIGSILIKGEGKENSIAFDSLYIYQDENFSYIDTNKIVKILINNSEKINISNTELNCSVPVISDTFKSTDESFELYTNNTGSTLKVDNLVVKNSTSNQVLPQYWYKSNNIIESIDYYETDSTSKDNIVQFKIKLTYTNSFQKDDILGVFIHYTSDEKNSVLKLIQFTVSDINNDKNYIIANLNQTDIEDSTIYNNSENKVIFLISRNNTIIPTIQEDGFTILNGNSTSSKIGDLSDINITYQNNSIDGSGIYTEKQFVKEAAYIDGYVLDKSDKSSRFASTEWVQNYDNNLLPSGSIIMFNTQNFSIPAGWELCDGQNNTPNLSDKFIKDTSTTEENVYLVVYIMKV